MPELQQRGLVRALVVVHQIEAQPVPGLEAAGIGHQGDAVAHWLADRHRLEHAARQRGCAHRACRFVRGTQAGAQVARRDAGRRAVAARSRAGRRGGNYGYFPTPLPAKGVYGDTA